MQTVPSVVLPSVSNELANELALEKDGFNRPLDMVLAAKINDMKATVAAPYWKRSAKTDGKGPELAMLKNKAMSLAKDLENLLKLHERQETVVADLRAKLRHLRQDATTKDKKLELAHRTIERLSVDKHGLEAGDAAKKTYIRQLECRVSGMKSTSELELMCGQLQAEIQALRSEIQISKEKAVAAEEAAAQHQSETLFLRRGIQLAAEQLARSSGTDISASLLMAVAQGQNEAVELSSQLAESQGQVDEMAGALTAARTHLQAQHDALKQWQQWEETQSQQAREREEALKNANEVSKRLLQQVETLQAAVNEARRERDAARHRFELEKTARQDSEERTRGLHSALKQSEQKEVALRSEIQRLIVNTNTVSEAGAAFELPRPTSRPTSGAAAGARAVAATSIPPTRPHSAAAAARFSPAGKYPLDASIAALERELAQMAAHPGLGPPTSSPQKMILQTGGTWHTNPLAETDGSPDDHQQQQAPIAAPSAAHSLTESAAWQLLERGFDQQRAEDRRMNAVWQQQNKEEDEHEHVVNGYAEQEEESASAISLAGPSSSVTVGNNNPNTLRVEVSDAPGRLEGAVHSPGMGSNKPIGVGALPSPDLGQFSSRASAEWLNRSIGDGFKQLEEDGKKTSGKKGGGRGVTVHAFAGVAPGQQQQQQQAVVVAGDIEKVPARQSLFDLARMEINY